MDAAATVDVAAVAAVAAPDLSGVCAAARVLLCVRLRLAPLSTVMLPGAEPRRENRGRNAEDRPISGYKAHNWSEMSGGCSPLSAFSPPSPFELPAVLCSVRRLARCCIGLHASRIIVPGSLCLACLRCAVLEWLLCRPGDGSVVPLALCEPALSSPPDRRFARGTQ